jgi:hypothetical protein
MSPKSTQLIDKYLELRECVNQSSIHTKRQIDLVEKNVYIVGIISLIISLGASYYFEIIKYWIPAGFLLLYFWTFCSIRSSKKHFEKKTIDKGIEIYNKTNKEVIQHTIITQFKNIFSFINSITIIYILSFFIIIAFHMSWIEGQADFEILIPLFACLYYIPAPYLFGKLLREFENKGYQKYLDNFIHFRKISPDNKISNFSIAIGLVITIYLFFAFILPIISFINTMPLIENWLLLFIIMIFQLILIFVFSNYFSTLMVKKELSDSITNFADINYLINESILNKKTERIELENLKRLYLSAKPYDYVYIVLFKFIPFYRLISNRTYLKYLSKK